MKAWQLRLEEILREHTKLVLANTPLEVALAQLARGAAELAGCLPGLSFIRVTEPHAALWSQDVWAVKQADSHRQAFVEAISTAIRNYGPQRLARRRVPIKGPHESALMIVPLLAYGTCYGYLCLGSDASHPVALLRRPLILALAHQALQTIHFESSRSMVALMGGAEVSLLTQQQFLLDLQSVADDAADTLHTNGVVKGVAVEVLGLTEGRDALVTLAVAGRHNDAIREVLSGYFAAGATEAWQAIAKDEEHYRSSIENGDNQSDQPSVSESAASTSIAGSRTMLAVPLRDAQGGILGVMNVEAPAPRALAGLKNHLQSLAGRAEAILREADPLMLASATSLRSVLARIGSQMPNLLDPDRKKLRALYQATLRRAVQMIGALDLKAAIAFCGEQVFTITPDATYGYTRELIQVWSWSDKQGLTGIARETRQTQRVPDVHAPGLLDIYIEQDPAAQSEMVVPLLHGDQVVGVLDFISPHLDAFTAKHQALVEAFARQVVQTLERARDIRSLWLAEEDRKLIQETSEGIEHMLRVQNVQSADKAYDSSKLRDERKRLLTELLRKAVVYTRSTYGVIFAAVRLQGSDSGTLADPQSQSVEFVEMTSYGFDSQQHVAHLALARSPSKIAVKAFTEKCVQDCSDIQRDAPDGALFGPKVKSALAVPVPGGDRLMGVLCLESTDKRMYSPAQKNRVAVLASQAANVISSANLYLYRLKMRGLLNLVDEVMTKSLAPAGAPIHPQICDDILKIALDLTEQRDDGYASLWLVNNGKLQYKAGTSESVVSRQAQPGIVKLAFERQSPVVVLDVAESPYRERYQRSYASTQSELAVPLLDPEPQLDADGRVLGVINVESPRKPAFSGRDVEIIELLARIMVTSMRLTEMFNDRIDFLADVSHGLPPLCAVVGSLVDRLRMLGILGASYASTDETHVTLDELELGIETLSTFIECSNTLVRHEKLGKMIEMEEVSLLTLAQDMANALQFYARRNERRVDIAPSSSDITVRCAKHLVRVAVFALIENAIEHGDAGDVILVRVRRLRDFGGRIEVIDHGEPIESERRRWLFSRRYSGAQPSMGGDSNEGANGTERPGSLGIGLDHVYRIVHEVHGGQARYRYVKHSRSKVFYLDLPYGSGEMA